MIDHVLKMLREGATYSEIRAATGLKKSTISYHAKKHGLARRDQSPSNNRYDWGEVQKKYDELKSTHKTIAFFGMSRGSWEKAIKRGDLVSRNHGKRPIEVYLVDDRPQTGRTALKARLLKEGLLKNECNECQQGPIWMGRTLPLELDHIDGNGKNNRLENLRILCPNCHSQTPTYGGKNIESAIEKRLQKRIMNMPELFSIEAFEKEKTSEDRAINSIKRDEYIYNMMIDSNNRASKKGYKPLDIMGKPPTLMNPAEFAEYEEKVKMAEQIIQEEHETKGTSYFGETTK